MKKDTIALQQYAEENAAIKKIVREIVGAGTPDNLSNLEYVKYLCDFLENIIAITPGHVYWLDRNNVYLGCNDQQAKSARLKSRKDIVGKTNYDMLLKEHADEINKTNLKIMETGESLAIEEYVIAPDGPAIYFSQKSPLRNIKNEIIGIVGTSLNISEKKKFEKERLNLVLRASNMSTWTWDITENVFTHDYIQEEKPLRFVGTLEEAIVRIHLDDQELVKKAMLHAIEEKTYLDVEYRSLSSENTLQYIAMRGKFLKNTSEMIGVCWDITKRKRAEKTILQQQANMANTTLLNSMGELATTLAHELNQPLAAITNYIKGCLIRLEKNNCTLTDLKKIMQLTYDQTIRAGEIINRMKNLIRKGELKQETAHINIIIKEIVSFVHHNLDHATVNINLSLLASLPNQALDKIQIGQVILNLIRNAIEAMQSAKTPHPEIKIKTALLDSKYTVIDIIDNGPGLPEEISAEFFKPYVTTKKTGMGMGLAICRTILEAHKGQLKLLLHENKGAWFRIVLPL